MNWGKLGSMERYSLVCQLIRQPFKISVPAVLVVMFTLLFCGAAVAMECDNFTNRYVATVDTQPLLDKFVSDTLQTAMIEANADPEKSCVVSELYSALASKLAATPFGVVEVWANKNKKLEKLVEQFDIWSVYSGSSPVNYPLSSWSGIAPSIRLAGVVIGTDKLGHFMAEGLVAYRIYQKTGKLQPAFEWGIRVEETYFGLWVSGVKSYADLAANYGGLKFWAKVVSEENPYFQCVNRRWKQVREFSWKDYVTEAWDEGINCSEYTPAMEMVVKSNLSKLGMSCPVYGAEVVCEKLRGDPNARWYLNPRCYSANE